MVGLSQLGIVDKEGAIGGKPGGRRGGANAATPAAVGGVQARLINQRSKHDGEAAGLSAGDKPSEFGVRRGVHGIGVEAGTVITVLVDGENKNERIDVVGGQLIEQQ